RASSDEIGAGGTTSGGGTIGAPRLDNSRSLRAARLAFARALRRSLLRSYSRLACFLASALAAALCARSRAFIRASRASFLASFSLASLRLARFILRVRLV